MKLLKIIISSIHNKLIIGFIVISLFVWIVSFIGLRAMRHIDSDYKQLSEKSLPLVRHLEAMRFSCLRLVSSASEFGYLQTEGAKMLAGEALETEDVLIQDACVSCHAAFKEYARIISTLFPESAAHIEPISLRGKQLHTAASEFILAKRNGMSGKEALEKKEEMEKSEMAFLATTDFAMASINEQLAQEKEHLSGIISASTKDILILSGLTFLISIALGIFLARSISKPIIKLTESTNNFSKGNLDVSFDLVASDEVGMLVASFREMAERIKQLITQLEDEIRSTKKAEELFKQSSQQTKLILDVAGEGIMGLDAEGNHVFTNPKACEILGYGLDELIGKNSHRIFHNKYKGGSDYPSEKCPIYETLNDGKVHYGEEYFWRKDGSGFPVEFSSLPVIENDKINGAVVTFKDITDRKNADEALRESEEMFRQLFNESNDPILLLDETGFINCNQATVSALGYQHKEEFLNQEPWQLSPELQPDGQVSAEKAVRMIDIALKKGYNRFEWVHTKSNGDDFPVEVMLTPIVLKGKQILYTIWRDLTEQKQAEKLKKAVFEISEAVNQTDDIDSFYARVHEIIKQLMLAENFYISLYDKENDLISFPYFVDAFDEAGPPVKPGKGCTEYVLRTGQPIIIDKETSDKLYRSGEVDMIGAPSDVWVGVPLKIGAETIGVMVVQDYGNEKLYTENEKKILVFVSEQLAAAIYKKQAEEKLKKYTSELKELNASKDKFFSLIAHDLKSPFNSIAGFSELLAEQVRNNDTEGIEKYAEIIQKSSKRAMDLLTNLMDWSRSQTGRMEFNPEYFEMIDLIRDIANLFIPIAEQKSITIVHDLPSNAPVYADKDMIGAVLRNLLSNAIKFTYKNGNIRISAKDAGENLMVTIVDNGIGIPPEAVDKLFRIDNKYSTPGTQNEKGTGLGLILCREFVQKNGGDIWLESDQEAGSTFCFTIPIMLKTTDNLKKNSY